MFHQQLLGVVEMGCGDRHDLPKASRDVGKKPPPREIEIGGSDLSGASQSGEDRM